MKTVNFELNEKEAMSSVQSWTGDAIDVALAADFEGSLSCLGIELGTENYDMSAPLHSLMQSVSTADYSSSQDNGNVSPTRSNPFPSVESIRNSVYSVQAKKTRLTLNGDEDVSIKRFCVSSEDKENSENTTNSRCRHSSSAPDLRATVSHSLSSSVSVLSPSMLTQILQIPDTPPVFSSSKNAHFQYVLGAATSIATKINEESMTYLNQGQSYEIKLKKLGDLTEMRGKMLKSIIRVGFQERRLQFSEKEQIAQWQSQRIGERIIEIDIPLSYGVYDVTHDSNNIHICEFLWDPTNETGVFIRLNCISTEFTPKKHGGEKGAPFRIQIETFSHSENNSERLHVAACQVKVFKPKGADRKHKTDREKMSKRPQAEQDKYKTSYDCTVFTECAPDPLYITGAPWSFTSPSPSPSATVVSCSSPKRSPDNVLIENAFALGDCKSKNDSLELSDISVNSPDKFQPVDCLELVADVVVKKEVDGVTQSTQTVGKEEQECLTADFSIKETSSWLKKNNFDIELFLNYNGTDLLRLSRDDCIKICGNADGVRLFNTLICKPVFPKKVLFVRLNVEEVFQAVYLHQLCTSHLISKLAFLFHIPLNKIHDVHIQMSVTAHYAVTDEVVENIQNESLFMMELILHDNSYTILLKPYKEDST